MIHYPPSTIVDRPVPKAAFYRHLDLTPRLKQRFVDDVESIRWAAKLTSSTLNVAEGKTVQEIAVFEVTLKQEEVSDDVFVSIDKQMPRHTLFLLRHADRQLLLINFKEAANAERTDYKIIKTFRTPWQSADLSTISLTGNDMDGIYEYLVGQVSGFGTHTAADTKSILELKNTIAQKEKQYKTLQAKVKREPQIRKQMEMFSELKALKTEINSMNDTINKLTDTNE